jgi:hypothetical protein
MDYIWFLLSGMWLEFRLWNQKYFRHLNLDKVMYHEKLKWKEEKGNLPMLTLLKHCLRMGLLKVLKTVLVQREQTALK